jgi:hypothetical protein
MTLTPDTPDYQRGTVNAQVPLAAVASGTLTTVVAIPPNAETIVVTGQTGSLKPTLNVFGVTTNIVYPVVPVAPVTTAGGWSTWWVDATQCLDQELSITIGPGAISEWYVYADAGVHLTADASLRRAQTGVQYVVPTIPSTIAGDHPPQELSLASGGWNANAVVLAAPGAGERYRVFTIEMMSVAAGTSGYLLDAVSNKVLCSCAGPGNSATNLPGQGYPLSTNAAINFQVNAGAAGIFASVYYTTENV